jgi:triosephosphate isomerase
MRLPVIVVNFKTYSECTGQKAVSLAKTIEGVCGDKAIVCPQAIDLKKVVENVRLPVYAQHADTVKPGRGTGHICPENLVAIGCKGTLLNHSEHQIPFEQLAESITRAKEVGLETLVCVATIDELKKVALLRPDAIALEPHELISSGVSVSKTRPELVRGAVSAISESAMNVPLLCGAGITDGEDVKIALELGTKGVLVASAITKAADQRKVVQEMAQHLR